MSTVNEGPCRHACPCDLGLLHGVPVDGGHWVTQSATLGRPESPMVFLLFWFGLLTTSKHREIMREITISLSLYLSWCCNSHNKSPLMLRYVQTPFVSPVVGANVSGSCSPSFTADLRSMNGSFFLSFICCRHRKATG